MNYFEKQPIMPKKLILAVTILLVFLSALFGYSFYEQEFLGKPVPANGIASHWALLICAITALVAWYVSKIAIITKVEDEYLFVSLGKFGKTKVALKDIESVEDKEGNLAAEFLGYGYRIKLKQLGYIGRGKSAIELRIKDQKRTLVITTDNASSLKEALQSNGESIGVH
ncbi:MAG: hypothetical protein OQJ80_00425 [Kangiella sp.]|nr:hypothetical protein [Kangiella sp.]